MKKINIFLMLSVCLLAFFSCDDDRDGIKLNPVDYVSPTLIQNVEQDFEVTKNTLADSIGYWEFTAADFSVNSPITYSIEADTVETFASAKEITNTLDVKRLKITEEMLNKVALSFIPESSLITLYVRVRAYLGTNGKLASVVSDIKTVSFTSFMQAEPLHIVGDVFGAPAWDPANYSFILFRDDATSKDTYTGYFKAGGFKLVTNANLGGYNGAYGESASGGLTTTDAEDIAVATAGYYTLDIDLEALSYTLKAYDASAATEYAQVGLIGDFNEWGTDLLLTKSANDPHIWTVDNVKITADGGIKFRANTDWGTSWGGTTFPFGVSGDGNIPIEAGTYFVKLNDITGHYIFYTK